MRGVGLLNTFRHQIMELSTDYLFIDLGYIIESLNILSTYVLVTLERGMCWWYCLLESTRKWKGSYESELPPTNFNCCAAWVQFRRFECVSVSWITINDSNSSTLVNLFFSSTTCAIRHLSCLASYHGWLESSCWYSYQSLMSFTQGVLFWWNNRLFWWW